MSAWRDVAVVIGVGGMGEAVARRLGAGRPLVLADFDEKVLERVRTDLEGDGLPVIAVPVDVSRRESVAALADAAAAIGPVTAVVHTAGLSGSQAPVEGILAVDLLGVAHTLDEFGRVIAPGGAGVIVASMAGSLAAGHVPAEQEHALAVTATADLLELPFLAALPDSYAAYSLAKRANQVRVQDASAAWGRRGARVNSISPGVISTPMGRRELAEESGELMRSMIAAGGAGRIGSPADVAAAVAFLVGPESSFITGTDLLVDGGVVAAVRTGRLTLA